MSKAFKKSHRGRLKKTLSRWGIKGTLTLKKLARGKKIAKKRGATKTVRQINAAKQGIKASHRRARHHR